MERLKQGSVDLPTRLEIIDGRMEPVLHIPLKEVALAQRDSNNISLINGTWVKVGKGEIVILDKELD